MVQPDRAFLWVGVVSYLYPGETVSVLWEPSIEGSSEFLWIIVVNNIISKIFKTTSRAESTWIVEYDDCISVEW